MSKILDFKGLDCPLPVINTKKYFDSMKEGSAMVVVDNEVAKNNLIKFAKGSNFKSSYKKEGEIYNIHITKGSVAEAIEVKFNKKEVSYTLVVSTDKFGEGSEELGKILMKSYLYALSESDEIPSDIFFLNAGVKLICENKDTVESIKALKDRGSNIASCGVCLDFYGLKDKVKVGEITNMYTIVEKMNTSEKTIKI